MGEAERDLKEAQEFKPIKVDPEKDETYEFLEYKPEDESYIALTKDGDLITVKTSDLFLYKRVELSTMEIIKMPKLQVFMFNKLRRLFEDGILKTVEPRELVEGTEFEKLTDSYLSDSISELTTTIDRYDSKYKILNERGIGYRLTVTKNE